MREIVRVLCGSHLYGTDIKGSDRDYKIVYIPDGLSILMQRAESLSDTEVSQAVGKIRALLTSQGYKEDPDLEFMSLRQFLKLLCQGQPNALDIAFAPESFYLGEVAPEWRAVQLALPQFICKNANAFVGYCRQQSAKYAVRTERYEAVKLIVEYLQLATKIEGMERLTDLLTSLEAVVDAHKEFMSLKELRGAHKPILHLEVCETRVPVTATITNALNVFDRKLDKYGERIRAAFEMGKADWKSLSHAIRIPSQAIELLETGKLVFPRPNRQFLRAIRLGSIPATKVGLMVEEYLERVQTAVEESSLPAEPNLERANQLVESFYRSAVLCSGS